MITVHDPADTRLAAAVLAFLRANADSTPVEIEADTIDTDPADSCAATLWAVRFANVCDPPTWREVGQLEHLASPITLLAGALPGHPGLIIPASVMATGAPRRHAVTLAAARTCTIDSARYSIRGLHMKTHLAGALLASTVDADIEHGKCWPRHEGTSLDWSALTAAEARRPRDAEPRRWLRGLRPGSPRG
jgi:hypothetical protein